jgi:hypothetical protein
MLLNCLGLGIIHSIDAERKKFYIITPVPLASLQSVNTLVQTGLAMPASFFLKVWQRLPVLRF